MRGRILTAVGERPDVTVAEVARRLGERPRRVRHHLEKLVEQGLVEGSSTKQGGRRVRRFSRGPILFEDASDLLPAQRMAIAKEIVRLLFGDVAVAAAAGTFATRADDYVVRIYGEVDDECLRALVKVHERAYIEMMEVIAGSLRTQSQEEGRRREIVTANLLFETPLWGRTASKGGARPGPRMLSSTGRIERGDRHGFPVELTPDEIGQLATAMTHELRGRLLVALAERPRVTIRELADRLEELPRRVRFALDALLSAGLASITEERLTGGVLERRYGAKPWVVVEGGAEELGAISRGIVRLLIEDIGVAADAGKLGAWTDEFQVRTYVEVDETDRTRLVEVFRRAYPHILDAMEAGRERVRESGEPGTEIVSALLLFEAPLWGSGHTLHE